MEQTRVATLRLRCTHPAVRALVGTLWMWSVTMHQALHQEQRVALCFANFMFSFLPTTIVSTGKQACARMAGAAVGALLVAVGGPIAVQKVVRMVSRLAN